MSGPRALLDHYDIQPKKSLGQNFLHDPGVLDKIAAAAGLTPADTVLEIGPGTGALTERLAAAARRVVAVEADTRLQPVLAERLAGRANVEIVYADFLTVNVAALMGPEPFIVAANLPYYITSAILRALLDTPPRPRRLVLTVQQEVADRLTAAPGDLSLLAVSVQFYGQTRLIARINPAAFWPRPDVDSAVVRIDVYDRPPVDAPDERLFFRVVRAGFSQKRKQLKNSLGAGLGLSGGAAAALLEQAGIDPRRRAETLALAEWAALARAAADGLL